MFKRIKKIVAFALALTMLMGMGTVAFAAERESEVPELTKVDGMTVAIDEDNDNGISPLWWSGNGPAPQVTKIVKERIEGGANEKAVLRLFINCLFVCINFDFFWLNKARQLYMDF